MTYHQKISITIFTGIFTFLADRMSKYWVLNFLQQPLTLTAWLDFIPTLNRGISFGAFDSNNFFTFVFISTLVIILLYFVLTLAYKDYLAHRCTTGHALVIAGGLSNLLDRVLYHGVVDFIALSYHGWQWPTFNIADIAITTGVLIIIIQNMRS